MAKAILYKGFIAPGLSRGLTLEHENQALAVNISRTPVNLITKRTLNRPHLNISVFFNVRSVMEYRLFLTGAMLCCHSFLALPFITYSDRRRTLKLIIAFRDCLALTAGLNRNLQSESSEIPATISNGGASRCQLITEPSGFCFYYLTGIVVSRKPKSCK